MQSQGQSELDKTSKTKKKETQSSEIRTQQRQVLGSMEFAVVGTTPGSINQSHTTRRTVDEDVARSSNRVSEEATIGGVESRMGN